MKRTLKRHIESIVVVVDGAHLSISATVAAKAEAAVVAPRKDRPMFIIAFVVNFGGGLGSENARHPLRLVEKLLEVVSLIGQRLLNAYDFWPKLAHDIRDLRIELRNEIAQL